MGELNDKGWETDTSPLFHGGVLVRVSIAPVKYDEQKASWEGKGLFGLHFRS